MDRNAGRIRLISIATVMLGVFLIMKDLSAQGLEFCDGNDPGCDACVAASGLPASSHFGDCLCCRPQLTGSWCGLRDRWADNGITLDADTTHWYLGVASGGLE